MPSLTDRGGSPAPRALVVGLVLTLGGCGTPASEARGPLVTPSGDPQLVIMPPDPVRVDAGDRATFIVTAKAGYAPADTVGGTCPAGAWSGSVYQTGAVTADCTVQFAAQPLYLVTPSASGVTVDPATGQQVLAGATATFTVTPPANFEVAPDVGGTCAPGTWGGNVYTTGAVTADCTLDFARGCETCGGSCVDFATPGLATVSADGSEACTTPCAVPTSPTPACGTCASACDVGDACINGACRCVRGAPACMPTLPVPQCQRGGCIFLLGSDPSQVTLDYRIIDVDAHEDQDAWIHINPASVVPGGDAYAFVMECQAGQGQLWFPNSTAQANDYDAAGTITDLAGLEATTTTVRVCQPWLTASPIFAFARATDVGGKGYYVKFAPNPGESGYAYQRLLIAVTDQLTANQVIHVLQYRIHVLPPAGEAITVTSSAGSGLSVTPAGPQALAQGATPSFTVSGTVPGSIRIGGTCPRGTWSGDVYTIDEPLRASCTVDFHGPDGVVMVTHGPDFTVTPDGMVTVPYATAQSFTVTSDSPAITAGAVGGTCPAGTWSGTTYTTGPITSSCTLDLPEICAAGDTCMPAYTNRAGLTSSPSYGDPGGAAFGPDVCPVGSAIVGLVGTHDGNVATLGVLCDYVVRATTGGVTSLAVGTTPSALPVHGSTPAASAFDVRCPAGAVVTRIDGAEDDTDPAGTVTQGVHALSVYCSTLSLSGVDVVASAPTLAGDIPSSWDVSGSTPFSYACTGDGAIVAMTGRVGQWIDAVGWACAAP